VAAFPPILYITFFYCFVDEAPYVLATFGGTYAIVPVDPAAFFFLKTATSNSFLAFS
jgi:hypothetical protein